MKTGNDFTVPNNTYLIGLAKVNHRGQIAPVASVRLPKYPVRIGKIANFDFDC